MTRLLERDKDTICATATAPGQAGLAVVRLSGPDSEDIIRSICTFLPPQLESHRVFYGHLKDPLTDEPIDEVLITYFRAGRSFTGETTFEISCHGSDVITAEILRLLCQNGARLAERGEFTYRAFMSGRIDLVQAESVLDLIQSRTKRASNLAIRQLQGEFSEELRNILNELILVLANLEANIDFSAEDIEVVTTEKLAAATKHLLERTTKLLESFRKGRILRAGFRVALVGAPNVGKSSLLNALLREERAIVTAIPGTTRDLVEGEMTIEGVAVQLVDTAGLRESDDEVERLGMERTRRALDQADHVLWILDATQCGEISSHPLVDHPGETTLIYNKADLLSAPPAGFREGVDILLSAKTHEGLGTLKDRLRGRISTELAGDSAVFSNARHFECLGILCKSLEKALTLMVKAESPDFIALELQSGLKALHELLGLDFDDQVMDRVFNEFCIGK